MENVMNQKAALCQLIENFLSDTPLTMEVSNGTARYFESFLLILKKEDKANITQFLSALLPLLKKTRSPFFRFATLIALYEKYKIYNGIMGDLQVLAIRINKPITHDDFWYQIIKISVAKTNPSASKEAQLMLLSYIINKNILNDNDLKNNYAIIQAILNCNPPVDDILLFKKNCQHETETPYWTFFSHILQMKNKGATALEINEMIKNHFATLSKINTPKEDYLAFIEILYLKLPVNFMAYLYYHEIDKLYFIFKHNRSLFHHWKPDITDKLTIERLITSLFKEFFISPVFIKMFCKGTSFRDLQHLWFSHVLEGKNIASAQGLPIVLTKRAAHIFRCTDTVDMSVTNSIVFSGIHALVDDEFYARQVVQSMRYDNQEEFWLKTMSILHKNGLTSRHVTEVMDYIRQKVLVEGVKLDIKHKKIQNLLNDVQNWHIQLNQMELEKNKISTLPDAGINDVKIEFHGNDYEISQIRKVSELYKEGKTMHHCVYTYKDSCLKRLSYIFSLRLIHGENESSPLITIELRGKQIVQAKGKHNRKPDEIEKSLIEIWAKEKNLKLVA
jgi:hypothetical protein